MGRYKVSAVFVCEGLLYDSVPDEEAPKIFRNRFQAAMQSFFNGVHVTISKCERIKEEDNGSKG